MSLGRGARWLLGGLVLAVLLAGGGLAYASYLLGGEPGEGTPVVVEVAPGQTAAQIGAELEQRGVVRSALAFRLVARNRGLDASLAAGTYDLETGMGVDEAIAALLRGPRPPESLRVTVPEGLTVAQTLERLAGATPHAVDDYRAVLEEGALELPAWVPDSGSFGPEVREPYEGLLFPQTYDFLRDATPREILQRMVDELVRVSDEVVAGREHVDRYRLLVLASLVEREASVDDERPLVAAVLHNRLELGMKLDIDATVLYALGEHRERVLTQDLQVDSPYNTYRYAGLPPTPIAAPGAASLRAALDPADAPFLYYVLECGSERHRFAETLDEHNRNVAAYRRCAAVGPGAGPRGAPGVRGRDA